MTIIIVGSETFKLNFDRELGVNDAIISSGVVNS